ncbi:hypothetical protein [Belliella aquatica]|uniref:Outer membrane protein beta-barrel domain-containing protein n=1 Tax=Belliella aquatica TaxID=1323734 RepID=A0ABQ1NBX6_9BACT|nr:hypothetical protein [Belliella aquatica]MCH7407494.1 hypothetical protein [Belliella aquatica]GGC54066.1 hypothetical protein GCM10010993_35580 [Belliella aquatica]
MKRVLIVFAFLCVSVSSALAQESKDKELIYRIGAGPAIEGSWGFWAVNFMNELSYYATPRFSINPSLTYLASVADFDLGGGYWEPRMNGENTETFVSSLFTDVRFQYDVIKTNKDFRLGIGFGPSFQHGGDGVHGGWVLNEFGEYDSVWLVERFARLGYVTQVTFDWQGKNLNRRNTLGISMSSFEGYWPYYLMVNYRLGFKL